MAITLTQIAPSSVEPGDQVTLTGTGFTAGAVVLYLGIGLQYSDSRAIVVSSTELTSIVPDLLLGVAGSLTVKVLLGEESSDELPLSIAAHPDIEDPYPLCSLGQVRQLLGVTASETLNDAKLAFLIKVASGQVASECRLDFRGQSYVAERYDGDGSNLLVLRHPPVRRVTALSIDGQAVPTSEVVVYENFIRLDEGSEWSPRLRATSRIFPAGTQNVSVSYDGGYVKVPSDISHACVLQVMHLMTLSNRQGVISEGNTSAGVTTTFAQAALCPEAKRACNRYKPRKVGIA